MSKRQRRRQFTIPSAIENPSTQDISRFLSIARRLKDPAMAGTVSDQDLAMFLRINLGKFDEEALAKATTEINRKRAAGEPEIDPAMYKTWVDEARKQLSSPEYKDRLLRIAEQEDLKNKNTAFSNATNLLLGGVDLASSLSQVNRYKQALGQLKEPGALPVLGKDPYLEAAKRAAEQGTYRESIAAEAAKQGIREAYQGELQAAKAAAGGQAGAYGALAQTAATRRARRGIEMMPQVEAFKQARDQQRTQMANLSLYQQAQMNRSAQDAAIQDYNRYLNRAQAAAELGREGNWNLRESMYGLGSNIPQALANRRTSRKYQDLYNTLWGMGLPEEQASRYAGAAAKPFQYQTPAAQQAVSIANAPVAAPSPYGINPTAQYTPTQEEYNNWLYKNEGF